MQLSSFLLAVQNFLKIDDVIYGCDPPDFVINSGGRTIGMELSTLTPSLFPKGGQKRRAEFAKWKRDLEVNPKPESKFFWGEFTMRESLDSLRHQIERKSKQISKVAKLHEEQWLLLHVDSGSSPGSVIKLNRTIDASYRESMWDFTGRYLYEIQQCFMAATPFSHVILFCGVDILAFPTAGNPYNLPTPKSSLLARGARASDEFLQWKSCLSTVHRSYDPSQGHLDDWFNLPFRNYSTGG